VDLLVLAFRLVLAAVLGLAAVAKLADRAGTRKAVVEFGAPRSLAGPLALALPAAELAAAGLLLVPGTARWGAVAALALLALFSAVVARALVRGEAPDCHCFGQLSSRPAGPRTLVRNGVLAGVAALAVAAGWSEPGPSAVAWVADLDAAGVVAATLGLALAAAAAGGAWLALHLLRQHGRLLLRLERLERVLDEAGLALDGEGGEEALPDLGLPLGIPAPALSLDSVAGTRVSLPDLLAGGRSALLVFTSPTCGPCSALLPELAAWQREHAESISVVAVSSGDPAAVRAEAEEHELGLVLVDAELSAYRAYQANGTPSAVFVADDGTIASPVAPGPDAVRALVARAVEGRAATPSEGLAVGDSLPELELADLEGGRARLRGFGDAPTVFLAWNPGCGFCRAMHEDLRAWEEAPAPGAPRLVVLSASDLEAARAEGFASTVLLDPDSAAAAALGAGGTPMAVLADAEGRVASRVVAGAPGVLALLGAAGATVSSA
jgi:thiol-disulfide isomerase/thioredoxin